MKSRGVVKRGALLLIIMIGVACCAPPEPEASLAEMKAAIDARDECFARQSVALDDGVSDASVVGRAVYRAC